MRTGYTDFPSRLPTQSSTLYSNNVTKYLLSMAPQEKSFGIDLNDEVVRGSIVTLNGEILPPAPRPAPPPAPRMEAAPVKEQEALALTPWQKATRDVTTVTASLGSALALGKATGPVFMSNMMTFGLAGLVGYRAVWGVAPALHSPLMSVTNAISGESSDFQRKFLAYICRYGRYRRLLHHGRRIRSHHDSGVSWSSIGAVGIHECIRRIRCDEAHAGHVQA